MIYVTFDSHNQTCIEEDLITSVPIKVMHSVKRYAGYAKNPEFRVIPWSGITVINVTIPLR